MTSSHRPAERGPETPWGSPPAGARWVLAVDIGGTNLKVGLVPVEGGEPQGLRVEPTRPDEGADVVTERVVRMARAIRDEVLGDDDGSEAGREAVAGVGIGSPGPLDRRGGVVVSTPNLGWRDYPVRDRVAAPLGLPAALDNDANCAVLGEWWLGAGRGSRVLLGFTLGTGVGGGIVLDGLIHHGVSDVAGELGHATINYQGRVCGCGNRGCLEAYCSGKNIAARAVEELEAGARSSILDLVDGDPSRVTAATVSDAAVGGDPFAVDFLARSARLLAVGVANALNMLNPDRIVIAGGVTGAGEYLFGPLREEVERRAFRPAYEACELLPAELPETAGVIGAAAMFLQAHRTGDAHQPPGEAEGA